MSTEYEEAKRYVLKRLSERPYHSAELDKALRRRKISSETISCLLEECTDLGYLNDAEWLDMFIRSCLRRRHSFQGIIWKMQAKGIPYDEAKEAVQRQSSVVEEKEAIQALLRTRYRSRDFSDRHEKEKVIAALMRKGFTFEAIRSCLEHTCGMDC